MAVIVGVRRKQVKSGRMVGRPNQKPRVITPGLLVLNQLYCDTACQTIFMIGPAEHQVKSYFGEQRTEGGGVEPQWLMSRSPVWQTVSSTHWQHPPDIGLQLQVKREMEELPCVPSQHLWYISV